MTPTAELAHNVVVVTDEHGAYRSECVCDWASDWYEDDDLGAELAGVDHLAIVIGPPDPIDKLLSKLLDLQDDIAETVLWFADNYTADLPVPELHPYHDGRRVGCWLLGYTTNPRHIDQLAELTGSTPTEDPEPNQRGMRYRRVVHSFGRVRFEIFAPIEDQRP